MFLPWLDPSLSAGGQNLTENFNNISLNVCFEIFERNKSLRQSRLCFEISRGVPEWNNNEWSKLLFAVQVLRKEADVYIFKVP